MRTDLDRHNDLMACHSTIFKALTIAQKDRRKVEDDSWVENEHQAVLAAANRWAEDHDGTFVTMDDVKRLETTALGHVDYASKFALYVAEAVIGMSR